LNLFQELKRRRVIRVSVVYAIVAWLLVQISSIIVPAFELPSWMIRGVVIFLVLGFPVAILLAWAFELTPDGVLPTRSLDAYDPLRKLAGRPRINYVIMGLVVMLVGWLLYRTEIAPPTVVSNQQIAGTEALIKSEAEIGIVRTDKSIAVLPFTNMTSDPEIGYFADGLVEEILNKLQLYPGLRVASRSSTLAYRDEARDTPAVGKALGVSYLLEGSVRRDQDVLRITIQLIRAIDDDHIWAQSFERPADGGFEAQRELSHILKRFISSHINTDRLLYNARSLFASQKAYDDTVLALRERMSMQMGRGSTWPTVLGYLNRALELEPDNTVIHTSLANAYLSKLDNTLPPQEAAERVRYHLDKIKSGGTLTGAYFMQLSQFHLVFEADYPAALENLDEAQSHQPSNAWNAGFRGQIALRQGNIPAAVEHFRRAIPLAPGDASLRMYYGRALFYAGDVDGAIREFEIGLDIANAGFLNGVLMAHLSHLYWIKGDLDRANALIDQILADSAIRHPTVDALLASALSAVGRTEDARAIRVGLQSLAKTRYVAPDALMFAATADGDLDAAFVHLHEAIIAKGWVLDSLRVPFPFMEPLRDDPRWADVEALLQQVESGDEMTPIESAP
jgi:TolB-like protein/Flp pilus assembly protein TadD